MTKMKDLAVGSVFRFSSTNRDYEKISNLYSKDLVDGVVRPNATNEQDAAEIEVVYIGSTTKCSTCDRDAELNCEKCDAPSCERCSGWIQIGFDSMQGPADHYQVCTKCLSRFYDQRED